MIPSTYTEIIAARQARTPPEIRISAPGGEFGNYNRAPEPIALATEDTFFRTLMSNRIVAIESRQPETLSFRVLRIFWLDSANGVAVCYNWQSNEAQFWFIGCQHQLIVVRKLIGPKNTEHTFRCRKCGYVEVRDSSG